MGSAFSRYSLASIDGKPIRGNKKKTEGLRWNTNPFLFYLCNQDWMQNSLEMWLH